MFNSSNQFYRTILKGMRFLWCKTVLNFPNSKSYTQKRAFKCKSFYYCATQYPLLFKKITLYNNNRRERYSFDTVTTCSSKSINHCNLHDAAITLKAPISSCKNRPNPTYNIKCLLCHCNNVKTYNNNIRNFLLYLQTVANNDHVLKKTFM